MAAWLHTHPPSRLPSLFAAGHGRQLRGNSAHTTLIWPGIELLGAVPTERKGIRNGCLYTVTSVEPDAVTLQELPGLTLTFEQVKSWLRLSYAQTYASVQGTEFTSQLRLHDTKHRFFTRRHLFVGLSRARAAKGRERGRLESFARVRQVLTGSTSGDSRDQIGNLLSCLRFAKAQVNYRISDN